MKHPTDLLADYALGELSPAEARPIDAHLEHCSRCRAELRESLVVLAESVPQARAPADGWKALQARLAEESAAEASPESPPKAPSKALSKPPARPLWQAWLVAVSLLIAVTGFCGATSSRTTSSFKAASKRAAEGGGLALAARRHDPATA